MKWPLLLLIVLGSPHALLASTGDETVPVATVKPGSVATVVVPVTSPSDGMAARFSVQAAEGVRMLGATTGLLAAASGPRRVPLTFALPQEVPAGALTAARLVLHWSNGTTTETDVRVRVGIVRRLELSATAADPTVPPGGTARVTYRLANLGNAADTVQVTALPGAPWGTSPASQSWVVPAGQAVDGAFEVSAPRTATLGEQRVVQVRAFGGGDEARASVALLVAESGGAPFGLAQIPVTVALTGSTASAGYNLAVEGSGTISPGTEVGIAYRRVDSYQGQILGQTNLWGPRALLSVRRDGARLDVGDLPLRMDGLATGLSGAVTGVQARSDRGRIRGGLVLARPQASSDGHLAQADLGLALSQGILSARLLDFGTGSASFFDGARTQLAALRYESTGHGAQRFSAEAGVVRQDAGASHQSQFLSVDATYRLDTPRNTVSARLRHLPGELAGGPLPGNEASLSGSTAVLGWLRALGSAYWSTRPLQATGTDYETLGASAGLQFVHASSALGIAWNDRSDRSALTPGQVKRRETLSTTLNTSRGPVSLLVNAEAGVVAHPDAASYAVSRLQSQLRYATSRASAWLGVNYTDERLFRAPLQAELGSRLRLGRVNLDAVAGASILDGGLRPGYAKAGAEMYLTRDLALMAGMEYRPRGILAEPRTFSIGIRKTLPLPLPMRRSPPISGVVFEDRNGNGRRDRNEPGLGGVTVTLGSTPARTDRAGHFAFPYAVRTGLPVRLDASTLPRDYLVLSAEATVPASGRVELAAVRSAALDVWVFDDRDGDGAFGAGDTALADIAVVARTPEGRTYPRTTDASGKVSFAALPADRYEITVQRAGQEPVTTKLELAPGARIGRSIPLTTPAREIHMWSGAAAGSPN
jgi:hypothetical protein